MLGVVAALLVMVALRLRGATLQTTQAPAQSGSTAAAISVATSIPATPSVRAAASPAPSAAQAAAPATATPTAAPPASAPTPTVVVAALPTSSMPAAAQRTDLQRGGTAQRRPQTLDPKARAITAQSCLKASRRTSKIWNCARAYPSEAFGPGREFDGFWKAKPQTLFPIPRAESALGRLGAEIRRGVILQIQEPARPISRGLQPAGCKNSTRHH
jgi:hypothetical protein